ncbi:DUF397 domain-containing protein [Streptomyces kronopolitis]|uniref:DUF397 domain-containing protein n=1 Tax=Streptomyces kronopolitis TaxID=1612435 RepID=UPI003430F0C0
MTSASTLSVEWQKSSYSTNGGNCIEFSTSLAPQGVVPIRDSKIEDGAALMFSTDAWASFVGGVRREEFSA